MEIFQNKNSRKVNNMKKKNLVRWNDHSEILSRGCGFSMVKCLTNLPPIFTQKKSYRGGENLTWIWRYSKFWKKNTDNDISPVRFGNGEEICRSSLQMISSLAESLTLLRNWKEKDILLIDNHRVMHGRKPFSGEKNREVLVSLTA